MPGDVNNLDASAKAQWIIIYCYGYGDYRAHYRYLNDLLLHQIL
jgi:hypothetical protein